MTRHPRGRLNEGDEGQLGVAVFVERNTVVISFAKPIHWLGLGAAQARSLAAALLKYADTVDPHSGVKHGGAA